MFKEGDLYLRLFSKMIQKFTFFLFSLEVRVPLLETCLYTVLIGRFLNS